MRGQLRERSGAGGCRAHPLEREDARQPPLCGRADCVVARAIRAPGGQVYRRGYPQTTKVPAEETPDKTSSGSTRSAIVAKVEREPPIHDPRCASTGCVRARRGGHAGGVGT
jgi:hypothetical protein